MLNKKSDLCFSSNSTDGQSAAAKYVKHFRQHKVIMKVGLCSTLHLQFLYQ